MDINTKDLLNEYMDILFRVTVAMYWFNVEGNIKNCTRDSKEYIDLCNLMDRGVELYIGLKELNINPPRWIEDNIGIDELKTKYKLNCGNAPY